MHTHKFITHQLKGQLLLIKVTHCDHVKQTEQKAREEMDGASQVTHIAFN